MIPAHQIGMHATQAVHVLLLAGQSSAAFVGTQTEWLRHAGVIHSSRLRAPDDQVTSRGDTRRGGEDKFAKRAVVGHAPPTQIHGAAAGVAEFNSVRELQAVCHRAGVVEHQVVPLITPMELDPSPHAIVARYSLAEASGSGSVNVATEPTKWQVESP